MPILPISAFKANFQSGARSSLYEVQIDGLGGAETFLCKAASLPASTIEQIEVPYAGRTIKIAGNRTFADWTVTIMNDVDFAVRRNVEAWMNQINGHSSNTGATFISEYMKQARVAQLDQKGIPIYWYTFNDIWPSESSEITLGYEENSIEEFTITFAVGSYWTSQGAL